MTHDTTMDKARLAAFADGELSPEEAAAVVMHLADHPADQAYVDEVMAANIALARAFSAPLEEPVPDRFRALLMPEETAKSDLEKAPARTARILPFRARTVVVGLMSAGLAAAAMLAVGVVTPGSDGLKVGPVLGGSALETALNSQASGLPRAFEGGGQLSILATLPAGQTVCREFELVSDSADEVQLGLACRDSSGWTVDVLLAETLAAPAGADGSYVPASGRDAGALDVWLDRRGAGMALDAAGEAALIGRGWAP